MSDSLKNEKHATASKLFLEYLKLYFKCLILKFKLYSKCMIISLLTKLHIIEPLAVPVVNSFVNNAFIDTLYIKETRKYETSIIHPSFNDEYWVTVEEYDDEITAKNGHEKWVENLEKWLPRELYDVTDKTVYKREYFE